MSASIEKGKIIMSKKAKYSRKDSRGKLFIDCTECQKGHNGDKSCSAGWRTKKPNKGGCFCGELRDDLEL
jgi:hypothetical protein